MEHQLGLPSVGRPPFRSNDESRNNVICGVLAMGEGWHNNHHAFPTSARDGLRWWELDTSYMLIRLLSLPPTGGLRTSKSLIENCLRGVAGR